MGTPERVQVGDVQVREQHEAREAGKHDRHRSG
jgi:hypothetical protein